MPQPTTIELRVPVSAELLERATAAAAAPVPEDSDQAHKNATELEALQLEIGRQAIDVGHAALAGGDRESSLGELYRTALGELERELAHTGAVDVTAAAGYAEVAERLDAIRHRQAGERPAGAIAPDRLGRLAATIGRAAEALRLAVPVTGRFVREGEDPELANPPWTSARVLPDGFEDLDPADLARVAQELLEASRAEA